MHYIVKFPIVVNIPPVCFPCNTMICKVHSPISLCNLFNIPFISSLCSSWFLKPSFDKHAKIKSGFFGLFVFLPCINSFETRLPMSRLSTQGKTFTFATECCFTNPNSPIHALLRDGWLSFKT